jgi:hypothetical protein
MMSKVKRCNGSDSVAFVNVLVLRNTKRQILPPLNNSIGKNSRTKAYTQTANSRRNSIKVPDAAGDAGRSLRKDEKPVNNDLRSEYENT